MSFARGKWKCKGDGCTDDAELSFMLTVATPGKQNERVKAGSKTLRLCLGCARGLAAGRVPAALTDAWTTTIQKVSGARWDTGKPKLIKR